jgi:hypothetical protein
MLGALPALDGCVHAARWAPRRSRPPPAAGTPGPWVVSWEASFSRPRSEYDMRIFISQIDVITKLGVERQPEHEHLRQFKCTRRVPHGFAGRQRVGAAHEACADERHPSDEAVSMVGSCVPRVAAPRRTEGNVITGPIREPSLGHGHGHAPPYLGTGEWNGWRWMDDPGFDPASPGRCPSRHPRESGDPGKTRARIAASAMFRGFPLSRE